MSPRTRRVLVVAYVVILTVLLGDGIATLLELDVPEHLRSDLLLVIGAMFVVQTFPIHLVTASGRHTVTLVEVLLVVGLFTQDPATLVIGGLVGAVPAFLSLRPEPLKFAVNIAHTGVWLVIPTLLFHLLATPSPSPSGADLAVALLVAVVAWTGSALYIRVPIGIVSGQWAPAPGEARALTSTAVTGLGAASLALLGTAVVQVSPGLLALLALPVLQVALSSLQQRRAAEAQRALDATMHASTALREADDAGQTLIDNLTQLVQAFDADRAWMFVTVPGRVVRVIDDGRTSVPTESLPSEAAFRDWLGRHADEGPVTSRDPSGAELAEVMGAREMLAIPVPAPSGVSGILLVGRRLGPFTRQHVLLARTFADAAAASIERQQLAVRLDHAGHRQVELERRASHDAMTGLANRSLFEREVRRALRTDTEATILFIDLNDFKQINDTHGHAAGDTVLRAAADRLRTCIRPGDLAARVGGDEFAVLLHDGDLATGAEVGGRIQDAFAAPVDGVPAVTGIAAAIGASSFRPGDGIDDVVDRADRAMYEAKRDGRREVVTAP